MSEAKITSFGQKLNALLRNDIQRGIVVIEATEIYGADDKTFDI